MTKVNVKNEVRRYGVDNEWDLCFQYCEYLYDDNTFEKGYRFIWRRPNGNLQPARGQARIPKVSDIIYLVSKAMEKGWGIAEEKKESEETEDEINQVEEE